MKKNRQTFNQILTKTEKEHSERLMRKARRANRIAKTLYGYRKQLAYDVKHKALKFLVTNLPGQTAVRQDLALTEFVVVGLKHKRSGLHFPADQFDFGF